MTFRIVQNDTAPPISSRLADSGEVVDLSDASNVKFHMEDKFSRVVIDADLTGRVNIVNADLGEVEYVFAQRDTKNVGTFKAEWQVLYDNGTIETFPSEGKVEVEVVEEIE